MWFIFKWDTKAKLSSLLQDKTNEGNQEGSHFRMKMRRRRHLSHYCSSTREMKGCRQFKASKNNKNEIQDCLRGPLLVLYACDSYRHACQWEDYPISISQKMGRTTTRVVEESRPSSRELSHVHDRRDPDKIPFSKERRRMSVGSGNDYSYDYYCCLGRFLAMSVVSWRHWLTLLEKCISWCDSLTQD